MRGEECGRVWGWKERWWWWLQGRGESPECVKMEDGGMEDVRAVSVSECDCRRVAVRDGFRRAKAAAMQPGWRFR